MLDPDRFRRRAGSSLAAWTGVLCALALAGCASGAFGFGTPAAGGRIDQDATQRAQAAASSAERVHPATVAEKLREGDAARASGELGRAMWSYLQAHKLQREAPEPLERIAALHLKDDPHRALELFSRLVDQHPESVSAHTGLGLARLAQGELEEARTALLRAVEIDPAAVVALSVLGVTCDRLGQHGQAQEHYRRATELRPDDYETLNNLGVSYLMSDSYAEAAEAFRKATFLEPRDPAVWNNLGLALGRLERYEEAFEAFRKAGAEQAALNNLGYVYFLNGRYSDGLMRYEQALMLGGQDRLKILRNLRTAREVAEERR